MSQPDNDVACVHLEEAIMHLRAALDSLLDGDYDGASDSYDQALSELAEAQEFFDGDEDSE